MVSIFKRKGLNRIKRPHKYQCTICGRMFKGKRSRDNHMIKATCKAKYGNHMQALQYQEILPPELVSLKPEIEHTEPQTTEYYGKAYAFINIPTGNRHLRAGVPLPRLNPSMRCAI